jgi:hypothetical protein
MAQASREKDQGSHDETRVDLMIRYTVWRAPADGREVITVRDAGSCRVRQSVRRERNPCTERSRQMSWSAWQIVVAICLGWIVVAAVLSWLVARTLGRAAANERRRADPLPTRTRLDEQTPPAPAQRVDETAVTDDRQPSWTNRIR